MRFIQCLGIVVIPLAACFSACADDENPASLHSRNGSNDPNGGPIPGGDLPDEQFPPALLDPYTGPPINYYDNTTIGYLQLKARVKAIFADDFIGGNTETYLSSKITLLGGADFKTSYTEARSVTPDFLLALDGVAKDACARAAANKTGPFTGIDPANDAPGGPTAVAGLLYSRMLFRSATDQEKTDGAGLVSTLVPLSASKADAWAGLCEALVRHPDSIFTLPPSVTALTGAEKEKVQLVKLSQDLAGRPPTNDELTQLAGKTVEDKVGYYLGTPDFRTFYFNRVRVRTESTGTAETDEPASLWTYLVVNGAPLQELLTADYSVNADLNKVPRGPEHGKTGILTMPGFIKSKPGLPHYNYAARVMTDYLGQIFEVPQDIVAMRVNSTASSTVEPGSRCIACHGVLTPLATQRLKWADDGTYRTTDEKGAPIDDSDRGMVPDYPYKGAGMEAFATQAVKKEKFLRQTFQSQFLFFLSRQMRFDQDERTVYLALWKSTFANNGDFRPLIKIIANIPSYLGQ
jgi:hypothetical protein